MAIETPALRNLEALIRHQGRTYAGLARMTGYSANYIARVAHGTDTGSDQFHKHMELVLGEPYSRRPAKKAE